MRNQILEIGNRIKEARKLYKVSQEVFAYSLGITQGHLSNIETGKAAPSKRLITSINTEWGIRIEWLMKGNGPIEEKIPPSDLSDIDRLRELIIRQEATKLNPDFRSIWKNLKYELAVEELHLYDKTLKEIIKRLKNSEALTTQADDPAALKYQKAKQAVHTSLNQLKQLLSPAEETKKIKPSKPIHADKGR